MEFKTTCEVCGKEYDNYMRTFYINKQNKRTRVCLNCRNELSEGYIYTNHIPAFCAGGDLDTYCFPVEEQLLRHIHKNTIKNYIACMDYSDGIIVDVCTTEKFWWVRGYSNLSQGKLPDWKEKVKELYGDI